MPSSICHSVLQVLVACLFVVTIALVGVIWREFGKQNIEEPQISTENLLKYYPGFFKTDTEQKVFEQSILNMNYVNRTAVTETTIIPNKSCHYKCFNYSVSQFVHERKKQAPSSTVFHGCCISSTSFTSPIYKKDMFGRNRTLLQNANFMQYFEEETCISVAGCTTCACSTGQHYSWAVVLKIGVFVPNYIKDLEIAILTFKNCCKCVNN